MSSSAGRDFVTSALRVLAAEKVHAYRRLLLVGDGLDISISLGEEDFCVCIDNGSIEFDQTRGEANVVVEGSHRALLCVLDGESRLLDAIKGDEIQLTAELNDLGRFELLFERFVKGAFACRSMPGVLENYRNAVSNAVPEPVREGV